MLADIGPRRMIIKICVRIRDRCFPPKAVADPFDQQYGVETGGFVDGRRLGSGHPHDRHSSAYWGTPSSLFDGVISLWRDTLITTPYSLRDYTLIDIGCGKGRVVMLASDVGFRKVIGVELNPALASIARQNLAKWQGANHICTDIAIHHADALDAPIPESPVLIYFFNSFDAYLTQLLLDRLQALSQTRSTPIDFIYTRPEHAELFERVPGMHLHWSGDVRFSAEDAAADIFHGSAQGCSIFRLAAQ